jgi:hypothetical protein
MSEDLRRECGVGDEGEKFHLAATLVAPHHLDTSSSAQKV